MMDMKSKIAEIDAGAAGQLEVSWGPTASARSVGDLPMEEDFNYDIHHEDDERDELSPAVSTEDVARYIADLVASLASMAREARLDLLNYLLDMAHVEAELQARRGEAPDEKL